MIRKLDALRYVIFSSGGNDSIALTQFVLESGLENVAVVYSDTGWAADFWPERIENMKAWVTWLGFQFHQTESEGMVELIKRKSAWPRGGGGKYQFCTLNLKQKPALEWLDVYDPLKQATCLVGIRREESRGRAHFPEYMPESENHGGRQLWAPLVRHKEVDRNALLERTPFEPLPYRSKECWPCVNANKKDLSLMDDSRTAYIEMLEQNLGINNKGNPRVMFSPKRHNGSVGIRAVVEDAKQSAARRGFDEDEIICDGGWCGI